MDENKPTGNGKRRKILSILALGFIAIGLAFFLLWFFDWRFYVSTRDAYVHGNQVMVTSQIPGYVTSINADDTDIVTTGEVLVTLDTTDNQLALEEAKSRLADTVRSIVALYQQVDELKAEKVIRQTEKRKAAEDFTHRKNLLDSGAVSLEDFEHAKAAYLSSMAAVNLTVHKLQSLLAETENTTVETHPRVLAAKESLRMAWINLQRCTIRAPVGGMVARRSVQVGEAINPSDPLMAVVPLDEIWVDANYKETELTDVRLGQDVEMTADIYGSDVIYHGKVIGIEAGTGSVFSVLPPQNATGNWIKIVQRLPVRVSLDPEEIKEHPLRLGLSMDVTVDIHNTDGAMIPSPTKAKPLYQTNVFAAQEIGAEELIEAIIAENSTFSFTAVDE